MRTNILTAATVIVPMIVMAPSMSNAQSVEDQLQAAINMDGGECTQVTYNEGAAMMENGNILVGAVCSNADRWLLEANPNTKQIERVFPCSGALAVGLSIPFCE